MLHAGYFAGEAQRLREIPCHLLVSGVFSSLSEDLDSIRLERLFLLFPMVKTVLCVKIFEIQRYLGEMKL